LNSSVAASVRSAGQEMAASLGRGGSVSQSPLITLRAGMSAALLEILFELELGSNSSTAAVSAIDATGAAAVEESAAGSPKDGDAVPAPRALSGAQALAAMAATPDAFGRTPLHVAGALGDAHSSAVLLRALRLSVSPGAGDAVERVLRLRDGAGWTAAELAEAIHAHDAADILSWEGRRSEPAAAGERGVAPPSLPTTLPVSNAENDTSAGPVDDGGWFTSFISPAAAAAAAGGAQADDTFTVCGISVVDATAMAPELFARAAYAPRIPVLVRNALNETIRALWHADSLIAEVGSQLAVLPSTVPSGIPGGGGGYPGSGLGRGPPPSITLTAFIDALRMCDGGDARDNPRGSMRARALDSPVPPGL
jgi:hypothetical protein